MYNKDTAFELKKGETNKTESLENLICITNGKNLYIRQKSENYFWVFNIQTGVNTCRPLCSDGACDYTNLTYDTNTGEFYRFSKDKTHLAEC